MAELTALYGNALPEAADVIVALGGDGFMLETLHRHLERDVPIFGMHRGSVGFLMNGYDPQGLRERLARAVPVRISPLEMRTCDVTGAEHTALAFNEVSLLRETRQTAKIPSPSTAWSESRSWPPTAFLWRRRSAAPPTISRPMVRSFRWAPASWH